MDAKTYCLDCIHEEVCGWYPREGCERFVSVDDIAEVKHGKWLDNETSYSDVIPQTCTCSVCGKRSSRPVGDFCKWCGTDMREDTNNQITVCPMCPDCPDNCPLETDMRKETEDE